MQHDSAVLTIYQHEDGDRCLITNPSADSVYWNCLPALRQDGSAERR
jgi:hypothetical protein